MDPIIFTIPGTNISLHWYGLIMAVGIILASMVAEWGVRLRGEDSDHIWELMIWAVPAGILGARLWYVLNDILGGGRYYLEYPLRIIYLPEGGLHFYGAVLFGAVAGYAYVKRHRLDFKVFLDAAAPALLIGQALVRPANFINQELYGPPTDLPWGIAIDPGVGKIYWTDTDGPGLAARIRRANLDGSVVESLLVLAWWERPWAIALDLEAGKMYWTR